MHCAHCGIPNPDDAKFCTNCGQELRGQPASGGGYSAANAGPIYAGFWRRFVAYMIDNLILSIPSVIIAMLFGIGAVLSSGFDEDLITPSAIFALVLTAIWIGVLIYVIQIIYYAAFESSKYQATPGKLALGVIVTDMDGGPISFGRALGRNVGKLLSGLLLNIGYIMVAFTRQKQALHDMLADCLVVMRPFPR